MIEAWEGSEYHLSIKGNVDGEEIDVQLSGADAQDAMKLYCETEWQADPLMEGGTEPDLSTAVHKEIKILAEVEIGGETRFISLEHADTDFQSLGEGATFTIIPHSEVSLPEEGEVFFEWEYTNGLDGDETFESSANSGFMTLEKFSGTPLPDSVVFEEGTVTAGMYVDASWSASERITMSFTAPCTVLGVDVD